MILCILGHFNKNAGRWRFSTANISTQALEHTGCVQSEADTLDAAKQALIKSLTTVSGVEKEC